jgi:1-acyl-sn-glycerol-3-phosphate acyltransferase
MLGSFDLTALMAKISGVEDPDSIHNFSPGYIETYLPIFKRFVEAYFRAEVRHIERIPDGPSIIVGNHNAGLNFIEPFLMGAEWYSYRGFDEPMYYLAHDGVVVLPVLAPILLRIGVIRAKTENARKILDAGKRFAVFPGGEWEAFRPYRERNVVDFAGHDGFARLAVETGHPVVPMMSLGGHETFFILDRGEDLAKKIGMDRLIRSRNFPISVGLPWGLTLGPLMYIPLPAKLEVELGQPFTASDIVKPRMSKERKVQAVYRETIDRIQRMLHEADDKRFLPVIG